MLYRRSCKFISDVAVVLIKRALQQVWFYFLGATKAQSMNFNGGINGFAIVSQKVELQLQHIVFFFECANFTICLLTLLLE